MKDEHAHNRALLARPAGRAGGRANAREARGRINAPGGAAVFSIHPEAAERAVVTRIPLRGETNILLMSDGFFRLVEPYGLYDAASLMAQVKAQGDLPPLIHELRMRERDPADDVRLGRLKTKDDACALWLNCILAKSYNSI
ncbi:MAG: hypothetical protein KIS81_12715 [Maricaulaceae bacterium]|nr:hypothetical protein [Maricaulaceae bacterium]